MREVTIATRISGELADQVQKLAEALGRNKSWLLHHALQAYVDSERQFIDAVHVGITAYQEDRTVEHAEVVADWQRRRESRGN